MCAIEDRLDGLDEIEGPFGNGRLDDTIEEWFESSESGESDCGYDVSTRCQVEWLESKCPATAQYILQGSTIVKDFTATESPNGISWTWEQCAKECYLSDECEFWILNNACQLRADKSGGYSTQNSMQVSGYKNANCDGVSESCKASCKEMMQTRLEDEEAEWRASVEANEVSLQLCSYIISLFIDLHSLLTTILALCLCLSLLSLQHPHVPLNLLTELPSRLLLTITSAKDVHQRIPVAPQYKIMVTLITGVQLESLI